MIGRAGIISIGVGILLLVVIVSMDKLPKPRSCYADIDCSGKLNRCVANLCVQCSANADCPSQQFCNKKNGMCEDPLACTNNRDCNGAVFSKCLRGTGECVECIHNRNCPTGQYCVNNTCLTTGNCTSSDDCADPLLPYCINGVCSASSLQNNLP
jgi:Cys-rich repeat protein